MRLLSSSNKACAEARNPPFSASQSGAQSILSGWTVSAAAAAANCVFIVQIEICILKYSVGET